MSGERSYRDAAEQPVSKDELLDALRESGDEFLAKLRSLPEAGFEAGRYEQGWNARQILAHVAAIEWTYANLIDIAREAESAPPADGEPATRPIAGGMDAYNERQVAKRADAPVAELLDEFERNREKTIAAVEEAPEPLFSVAIRSGGGIPGPLGSVLMAVAVSHVHEHLRDILGGG